MPCISSLLHKYCKENKVKFECLKKGTKYLRITLSREDRMLDFPDVLSYSSPCTLEKFLRQWGASATKSVFPYQKYSSIEEMRADTEFPKYEEFYSSLKKVNFSYHMGHIKWTISNDASHMALRINLQFRPMFH